LKIFSTFSDGIQSRDRSAVSALSGNAILPVNVSYLTRRKGFASPWKLLESSRLGEIDENALAERDTSI
jgi:hypothetical protein